MAVDDLRSTYSLRDKSGLFHERMSSESAALFSKMIEPTELNPEKKRDSIFEFRSKNNFFFSNSYKKI